MKLQKKTQVIIRYLKNHLNTRDDWCTPSYVAEEMKDLIKDKIVCDLGCQKGYFMRDLQNHAAKVIGVEKKGYLVKMARRKGFEVIQADYEDIKLPAADVYYIWAPEKRMERVLNQLRTENKKGKFVKGYETERGFEIKVIDI